MYNKGDIVYQKSWAGDWIKITVMSCENGSVWGSKFDGRFHSDVFMNMTDVISEVEYKLMELEM